MLTFNKWYRILKCYAFNSIAKFPNFKYPHYRLRRKGIVHPLIPDFYSIKSTMEGNGDQKLFDSAFWKMLVTKDLHLLYSIWCKILWKSMGTRNCLVMHFGECWLGKVCHWLKYLNTMEGNGTRNCLVMHFENLITNCCHWPRVFWILWKEWDQKLFGNAFWKFG